MELRFSHKKEPEKLHLPTKSFFKGKRSNGGNAQTQIPLSSGDIDRMEHRTRTKNKPPEASSRFSPVLELLDFDKRFVLTTYSSFRFVWEDALWQPNGMKRAKLPSATYTTSARGSKSVRYARRSPLQLRRE